MQEVGLNILLEGKNMMFKSYYLMYNVHFYIIPPTKYKAIRIKGQLKTGNNLSDAN